MGVSFSVSSVFVCIMLSKRWKMAASNSTSTRRTGLVPIATTAATAGHGFLVVDVVVVAFFVRPQIVGSVAGGALNWSAFVLKSRQIGPKSAPPEPTNWRERPVYEFGNRDGCVYFGKLSFAQLRQRPRKSGRASTDCYVQRSDWMCFRGRIIQCVWIHIIGIFGVAFCVQWAFPESWCRMKISVAMSVEEENLVPDELIAVEAAVGSASSSGEMWKSAVAPIRAPSERERKEAAGKSICTSG